MAFKMKGFKGFSSPAKLRENYIKGFKNMSDKQLENVIKRQKARGTSKNTAFENVRDAETSIDSLQTAQKELNRRKLNKMDPSGRIRNSKLGPKKSSATKVNKKLIDRAAKIGKRGNDMLKELYGSDEPTVFGYGSLKKPKNIKKIKYPKVAKGVRGVMSAKKQFKYKS